MTAERISTTKHNVSLRINKPPVDEQRIAALEARIGCRLPEGYREFMLLYNGGRPKPAGFRFAQRNGRYADAEVDWFLSLHDGEFSNIEKTMGHLAGRIPLNTLPIAGDPFGNCILLGLHGDVCGKVYFWDHEREPEHQPDWSNIDLVANSFDEFMRRFEP